MEQSRDYLVVDLEATCDRVGFPRALMETIEIGAVYVDGRTLQPLDEFQTPRPTWMLLRASPRPSQPSGSSSTTALLGSAPGETMTGTSCRVMHRCTEFASRFAPITSTSSERSQRPAPARSGSG